MSKSVKNLYKEVKTEILRIKKSKTRKIIEEKEALSEKQFSERIQ